MSATQHGLSANDPIDDRGRSSDARVSLVALARDPSLIKGVYNTCDQWCVYCAVTDRCLAFRCTTAEDAGGVWDLGESEAHESQGRGSEPTCIGEGPVFLKALADAEDRLAPPEIEAVMSADPQRRRHVFTLDDPLERRGRAYLHLADAYLQSRPDWPPIIDWRPSGPTPLEVLTWYHVLAPARIFRAILCDTDASDGVAGRRADALAAAKVALLGIDRSLDASVVIRTTDDDPRLALLQDGLRDLRAAVETRFPDARAFVRPGLDNGRDASSFRSVCRRLWRELSTARRFRRLLHWRHEREGHSSRDVRGSHRGSGSSRG
jgi:hypothetical protein